MQRGQNKSVGFPWITVTYMGLLSLTFLVSIQFPKNPKPVVVSLDQIDHLYFLEDPPIRKVLVDLGLGDMALAQIKNELGTNGPRADISKCNVYLAVQGDITIDKVWIAVEYPYPNQPGTGTRLVAIEERDGHHFIGEHELTKDHYSWIQTLISTKPRSYKIALPKH